MVSSEQCDASPGHNETIKTVSGVRDEERCTLHAESKSKCLPEGERTDSFFTPGSASASNNSSLVFVINSESLIYIFQQLDVW